MLNVRDPESWYTSVAESIYVNNKLSNSFPYTWISWWMGKNHVMKLIQRSSYQPMVNGQSMFGAIESGTAGSVDFFNDWVQHVTSSVPKEKLLIFNVKEGWEPLCKFLDLPIPKNPFPRVNDTKTLKKYNQVMIIVRHIVNFLALPLLLSLLVMAFFNDAYPW